MTGLQMARPDYNDFIKAMFAGDVDAMNESFDGTSVSLPDS